MNVTRLSLLFVLAWNVVYASPAPLPDWNPGRTRSAIIGFVEAVTEPGGAGFVPVAKRIAVFDNDGTLWCEQPAYPQLVFGLDRAKALAARHLEWHSTEPFKSALADYLGGLVATGVGGLNELTAGTGAGQTVEEYAQTVRGWLATAKHPRFGRPYTRCVYEPMLELLAYLRAHRFETYIVSGGELEFMRPWTEEIYGVPPERVIGSTVRTRLEMRNGKPVVVLTPKIDCIDDGAQKVLSIQRVIGRRPIVAFGNSDGDLPMLEWTASGPGLRLCALVHHTDAKREYAYDRTAAFGRLDKGLDEAKRQGWVVVDMKNDWKRVFPPRKRL